MTLAQQIFRWGAIIFGVLAIVPGYFAVKLRWSAGADFDVTGFLFLIQNLPRLTAIVLTLMSVGMAIHFWRRSV